MNFSQIFVDSTNYFVNLPLLELAAVISALIYVVLAAKGNIWCWPAAFMSTVLYTAIFYDVYLWMDSLLQVYYMVMAVYGWYCWRQASVDTKGNTNKSSIESPLVIQKWSVRSHVKIILILAVISLLVGWLMASFTPAAFPYFDSATTVFAVFATYMVTKKVLENWLYWLVIDFASIYIYLEKGLAPTAVLFALYVILAAYGYLQWSRRYKQQLAAH